MKTKLWHSILSVFFRHSFPRKVNFHSEKIIDGIRYDAGNYLIIRLDSNIKEQEF